MDKIDKIRQEIEELYARIDKCIDTLIKARLNKDTNGEGKSLFQMEGLMVGTQQFLCWILDTLSEDPDKSLEEEVKRYYSDNFAYISSDQPTLSILTNIARHFAKWQKEQMLKDAVEGEAEELYNDGESQCIVSVGTYFKPGDEVYVIPK